MSSYKLAIPPARISTPNIKKPLLCGPGPCDLWPSVQAALSTPVVTPLCDDMFKTMDEIRAGLQYAFQTSSKLVLAISGSGHSGMEAIINNLVAPGETMLIAARGIWDERAQSMAERYGIKAAVIRRPPHQTFTPQEVELALKQHRPKALYIVHGDSSTGTLQDISQLGKLCHKHGALLLVDSVMSLGGIPFLMDEWEVDATYAGTQKALSGPAGMAPVAFSERAQKIIQNRKHEPIFYLDLKLLADQWNCYGNTRKYHHTISPPMLFALHACLKHICEETLPVCWARQTRATRRLHDGLRVLRRAQVEFYVPKPEDRLDTVTTLTLPKGYDYAEVVKFIREKHNIVIFGGLGPTGGKALRIGIMGVNATEEVADAVIAALGDALVKLKKSHL